MKIISYYDYQIKPVKECKVEFWKNAFEKKKYIYGNEKKLLVLSTIYIFWNAIWMYRHQFHTMFGNILRCFFFFRFPCSTILMWKNVIVAGFGNGQIRLYSAETGKLAAQVNAHARWVTALDVASDNGMVSLLWIVLINPIILWWEKKLTLAGIHKFCITL